MKKQKQVSRQRFVKGGKAEVCIDKNTAIIFAAIIGVVGYAFQNYFVKKRELEKREYESKEQHYVNFLRILATTMSPTSLEKGKFQTS